jgi:hypothetical protein
MDGCVTVYYYGYIFFKTFLFNPASSAAPQIPLCGSGRMLGLIPGVLRLWHWQSDALTIRIDLSHKIWLDLILINQPTLKMGNLRTTCPLLLFISLWERGSGGY